MGRIERPTRRHKSEEERLPCATMGQHHARPLSLAEHSWVGRQVPMLCGLARHGQKSSHQHKNGEACVEACHRESMPRTYL